MNRTVRRILVLGAALAALFPPSAAFAAGDVATAAAQADTIVWQALVAHDGLVLTVSRPDGAVDRHEFRSGEVASYSVFDRAGQLRPEGSYVWELRIRPVVDAGTRALLDEARRNGDDVVGDRLRAEGRLPVDTVQSGAFSIVGGEIVAGGRQEAGGRASAAGDGGSAPLTPAAGRAASAPVARDQVIPDDLIVQSSLCVGFDCVNGESFGFDTIRLKENSTRIKFEDTSAAGFPSNDWQLTANDSAAGGQNKFSIEDITGARVPFTVEAGATTNSVYVDSTGRIGFRTSTPVLDLHVNTSNTPALRLEQNNSGGFTAQTWDVAGNEANFFVRDVTGGSRLSFRIRPGAPTSSIDINADGNVGIGTASADEKLTVDGGVVLIRILNNAANTQVGFNLQSAGGTVDETWFVRNNPANGAFTITDNAGGAAPFKIFPNIAADTLVVGTAGGVQRVSVAGALFVNGSQMNVPDYVFEPDYELESIADHAEFMWTNRHLPAVPKAERDEQGRPSYDVLGTQFGVLEEVEKAHIYIEQLHGTIQQLQADAATKDQAVAELKAELARLSDAIARLDAGEVKR